VGLRADCGITVCIPSIPPRRQLLRRAIASVLDQTLPADAISVAVDNHRTGAAVTRQRALEAVRSPWTAFLDDDDEFLPEHLSLLLQHALDADADYVFSWFQVVGGMDPFPPGRWAVPYDPAAPIASTITILVKTELAQAVGFSDANRNPANSGEDWLFQEECEKLGAKISHFVDPAYPFTWLWHHDSQNTSGLPHRW